MTETLDGEALIVHLGTGCYYSCRGSGETAWAQLLAGRTARETASVLARRFDAQLAPVTKDVEAFVAEAVAEGLVIERTTRADASGAELNSVADGYQPPAFEKYTDMQELLALDPVHDVDAAQGWPRLPGTQTETAV